ncbi:MAG: ttdA [Firmicutes bacterium]|nr:ttdA [Bacillota bacterium]
MRVINASRITDAVAKLAIEANYYLPQDVKRALTESQCQEQSQLGKEILGQLLENADIAAQKAVPMCQDTGMAVVFVELGRGVQLEDDLEAAINAGIKKGYTEGYLRKSVVADPLFQRKNTGDNTPAIIHIESVVGDTLKITLTPKGFGSENMSAVKMLKPADGLDRRRQSLPADHRWNGNRRNHGKSSPTGEKSTAKIYRLPQCQPRLC